MFRLRDLYVSSTVPRTEKYHIHDNVPINSTVVHDLRLKLEALVSGLIHYQSTWPTDSPVGVDVEYPPSILVLHGSFTCRKFIREFAAHTEVDFIALSQDSFRTNHRSRHSPHHSFLQCLQYLIESNIYFPPHSWSSNFILDSRTLQSDLSNEHILPGLP